ncbi:hypothetical protein OTERR_21140 [Oryzomicrobium terrae]|uniref:protein O-GlcNAc transferase n=2 Tax=Oryzomicrobium terrae TaxID=1735038 RepID=A0A5C1E9M6_9RHOO|nr:hypothetical protein OTERR_21140 [Oryzomicrobium terrae]
MPAMSAHPPRPASPANTDVIAHLAQTFAAGRYDEVVTGARALTHRAPNDGLAHKLLGSALHALGQSEAAVAPLQTAARLLPGDAQTLSNLGNALAGAGRLDEAVAAHQGAIRLQPEAATPRYNLGCAYLAQQRKAEALEQFWQAFERSPQDRALAQLCREVLVELGDPALQLAFCRANVRLLPDDAAALAMLGGLLLEAGESGEAEAWLQQAVAVAPGSPVAWSNLCVALQNRAALGEAVAAGRRAAELAPDWALAHNNLGTALRDAGALAEAKASFLRALEVDPDYAQAYYNLGCACADLGDQAMARGAFIEAVQRTPRADWLLSGAHACRQVGDWDGAELLEAALQEQLADPAGLEVQRAHQVAPFAYLTTPGTTAAEQLRVARHFAARFSAYAPLPPRDAGMAPLPGAPLRIGLLSADFRDHATAHLLAGALEFLDRQRFHLVAYDYGPVRDDAYRQRLRGAIPTWVDVRELSDRQAAERMRADRIDIAIDLKGWTQGFRGGILAHRPAPLQMQWLGFPGTMGAPWIDYIIADPVVIPPGAEAGYSEQVLRLPQCYQPNDRRRAVAPRPDRAALGLPESAWVLAAFHQPYKITRPTFMLWMRVLRQVPDALLWLLEGDATAMAHFCQAAEEAGVEASRLVWAPHVPVAEHLGRLACADLALDTFPVNAHTTASDALWAGVPQVAWCGDTFVARVSASVVRAAGLGELVADSAAGYEALVLDLARDRARLADLRQRLAQQRLVCPLFDSAAFAADLARGLELAWERYRQGLPPAHLAV